eukprot:Sspe_Gene.38734::Locus_18686_Transcript_2_2_Confidence_0.667_Length_661::g.38734::m.38734/K09584/PDIA6, TXNDC7; protein disulfide-isomerase A6
MSPQLALGVLAFALVAGAAQPGDKMEGVTELTMDNFKRKTGDGRHYLIEFYLPGCSWCIRLADTWKELGETVGDHDEVAIAKMDASDEEADDMMRDKYNVRGYPTVVLLKKDGKHVTHSGTRDVKSFLAFIKKHTGVDIKMKEKEKPKPITGGTGVVQVLNAETFDKIVRDPAKHVFVKFFAPWCGHCKSMAGEWEAFARKMK